ncbi:alpha-amylase [Catenaria anguillulae PL171]|uniref:Alpha-amylase n=1 Tax=Catenaria anguillulae PL171 TaxID=765915 RepID=A0A1Y2HUF0_9FUNG|nr:alpha-amylase [Catenaria anguillulae PL171]
MMRSTSYRTPLLLTSILALAAVLFLTASAAPTTTTNNNNKDVIVHLFNWPWDSVARECRDFLGPKGFGAVQISPPQEHAVIKNNKATYPWWQDYQPTSYKLETRRGGRAALANAIRECHNVGVKVYADAVINHMAAMGGVGWAGTRFGNYVFPGTYGPNDFHRTKGCPNDIDYNLKWQVQTCELVGLNDLKTSDSYVQRRIQEYLNDLRSLGIDGFRVDAAKHIDASELASILNPISGFKYLEVIGTAGEAVQPPEYTSIAHVTEFKFGEDVSAAFRSGSISSLADVANRQQLPSNRAISFIDNHDTQRGAAGAQRNPLKYKDGAVYVQAEAFLLAYGYGVPVVMSSYSFSNHDQGPPTFDDGTTKQVECGNGWECEHRWRTIANLVALRNAAAGAGLNDMWSNGSNQLAFGRGDKAFVGFSRGGDVMRTFQTGLPAGTYCDVANGDIVNGKCTGPVYTVDASRKVTAKIPNNGVLALHVDARVGGSTVDPTPTPTTTFTSTTRAPTPTPTDGACTSQTVTIEARVETVWGQDVYVVGSDDKLGAWNPANAVPLAPNAYPVWRATVSVPVNKNIEFKLIKKTKAGQIEWQTGGNRVRNVGSECTSTWTESW